MKNRLVKRGFALSLAIFMLFSTITANAAFEGIFKDVLPEISSISTTQFSEQNTATSYSENSSGNSFGLDMKVPESFKPEDGEHPYKRDYWGNNNPWLNLNPTHELIMFEPQGNFAYINNYNYNVSDPAKPSTSFLTGNWQTGVTLFNNTQGGNRWTAGLLRTIGNTTTDGSYSHSTNLNNTLQHMRGVAFDPTGSGQDDYVAYLGFDSATANYSATLVTMQADETNLSNANRMVLDGTHDYRHLRNVLYYEIEGYNSIIAGDFDGDGKDSLIVYDAAYKEQAVIREFKLNESSGVMQQTAYAYVGSTGASYFDAGVGGLFTNLFGLPVSNLWDTEDKSTDGHAADNMPMVQLVAGDITGDGKEDLVVTVSLPNTDDETDERWDHAWRGSAVIMYEHAGGAFRYKDYHNFNYVQVDGLSNDYEPHDAWFMRSASTVITDIDGDKKNELVTVGTFGNHISSGDDDIEVLDSMLAVIGEIDFTANSTNSVNNSLNYVPSTRLSELDDGTERIVMKGHALKLNANIAEMNDQSTGRSGPAYPSSKANIAPLSVAGVAFDGFGTQEYLVARGVIYNYNNGVFEGANLEDVPNLTYIFDGGANHISHPTVGNFGGYNGEESVLFVVHQAHNPEQAYNVVGYTRDKILVDSGEDYSDSSPIMTNNANVMEGNLLSSQFKTSSNYLGSIPALVAADYDDDVVLIQYESKDYHFVDPEIMAILETAPYFQELEYESGDTASTVFGIHEEFEYGESNSTTFSAGAYVGFEYSDPTDLFGAEAQFNIMAGFNNSYSETDATSKSMQFSTGPDEHQVVMISTPVIAYTYNTKLPNGQTNDPMYIQSPQDPVYSMVSLPEYNKSAQASNGDYPIIPTANDGINDSVDEDVILTSSPGYPGTYREPGSLFGKNVDTFSDSLVTIGHGDNIVTQEISKSKITETTKAVTHSMNAEVGGLVGGVKFGVALDYGGEAGTITIDISGVSRSGTVASVPTSAKDDYTFDWQFVTWDETFTNSQGDEYIVPVLGYYVANVDAPPTPPAALTAVAESDDAIKLTWIHQNADNATYKIYRVLSGTPIFVDNVDAGETEFTIPGLDPKTEYTFYITAVSADIDRTESYPSNHSSAWTHADAEGTGITLVQPENSIIFAGESAEFEATATHEDDVDLSYQWQVYRPDTSANWENIKDESGSVASGEAVTYTIENVQSHEEDYLYRCVFQYSLAAVPTPVYTNEVQVEIKPDREVAVELEVFSYNDLLANKGADNVDLDPIDITGDITIGDTLLLNTIVTYADDPYPNSGDQEKGEPVVDAQLYYQVFFPDGNGKYNPRYGQGNYTRDGVSDDATYGGVNIAKGTTFSLWGITAPYEVGKSYQLDVQVQKSIGIEFLPMSEAPLATFNVTAGYSIDGLKENYVYRDEISGVTVLDKGGAPVNDGYYVQAFAKSGNNWSENPVNNAKDKGFADLDLIPNTYQIRVFNIADDVLMATREITITKKEIAVIAPNHTDEIADITTFTTGSPSTVKLITTQPSWDENGDFVQGVYGEEYDLADADYGDKTNGYSSIFNITVVQQVDGYYLIPTYKTAEANIDAVADFQSKYAPTFASSAKLNVAGFELHNVSFSVVGSGEILANSSIGGFFSTGTEVFGGSNLSFVAQGVGASNPIVESWSVNNTPVDNTNMATFGMTSPTAETLNISELSADTNVVLTLGTQNFNVTATSAHSTPSGGGSYEVGKPVTVSVGNIPSGYNFTGWSSNIALSNPTATTVSFIMPAHNVNLSANWESSNKFAVTVNGSNGVADSGEGTYSVGSEVTVDAGSLSGFEFVEWTAEGITLTNAQKTSEQFTFDMPSNNVSLLARWQSTANGAYTVTVVGSYDPISGAGKYDQGLAVTLKAGTRDGYDFAGWTSDDGVTIIGADDENALFSMPSKDVTVTANWTVKTTPTPDPNPNPNPKPDPIIPDPDPDEEITIITITEIITIIREAEREDEEKIILDSPTPITRIPVELFTEGASFGEIQINTPAASIGIPNNAFGTLASLGGDVTVYAALENKEDGTAIFDLSVSVGGNAIREIPGGVSVAFPFENGTNTTVAKQIFADGTFGVIPKSISQDGLMAVHLVGPSSVLIDDNAQEFGDIEGHWANSDIAFVTSHALFQGTAPQQFDAELDMSRSMMWTVLARLENVDTDDGENWYSKGRDWAREQGISDGSDPDDKVSREMLITMLWRISGSPIGATDASAKFADSASISEYSSQAIDWAAELQILNGDDSGNVNPLGDATRGEVSAILKRYMLLVL